MLEANAVSCPGLSKAIHAFVTPSLPVDLHDRERARGNQVQLGAVSGWSLFASTLGFGNFTMFFN
jgi:hypothetical protein